MSNETTPAEPMLVEGTARVIRIADGLAHLEPEQSGGCGGCSAQSACNEKGIGTLASRLEARRFAVPDDLSLAIGDQVVLGIPPQSLVAASAVAYLIPLAASLTTASLAQWHTGNDLVCLLAALVGLIPGFALMRLVAGRLAQRESSGFRILRRTGNNETCGYEDGQHA